MKYSVALLSLFLSCVAAGQSKTVADSLAKSKLNELLESWTLGIDSTADAVDIRVYNKFKSLFDLNATVEDGFAAFYQVQNEKSGAYKTDGRPKAFDDYAHDVALQLKGLRIDGTPVVLDSNTANAKNMSFTVLLNLAFQKPRKYVLPETYTNDVMNGRRRIKFERKADSSNAAANLAAKADRNPDSLYRFTSIDTLRIRMALDGDTVRITGISTGINRLLCTNDADGDAVLDGEDSARTEFGDFTAAGRPDYDLDGIPDKADKCPTNYGVTNGGCPASYFITAEAVEFFLGSQYNAVPINLPELNHLGYRDPSGRDAMDVLQSQKGALKDPGAVSSLYAGAHYTHYFGQERKRAGLSVGLTYANFTAAYELSEPLVYTFKASDGVNDYRRQITINPLKEVISYSVYNVPLLFAYRTRFDKRGRSVLSVKAGPSLLLFSNTSNYNAVVDIGGIYQVDLVRRDRIQYYDYFDPTSKYNIYFTSSRLGSSNVPGSSADSIFKQLAAKGYDFVANKSYSGTQRLTRLAAAANLNLDVQHKLSEGLTVKAGLHLVYAPLPEGKGTYKPVDKSTDAFQSVYRSGAKSSYRASGISAGFVYNF